MIKFVDLQAQWDQTAEDTISAMMEVINAAQFILGEPVEQFEQAFADYIGVRHAIGVGCGLDALTISLMAMGIGPGDEVIVPVNTFIATALAVSRVGARPVFVDCDETYNINPDLIEPAITGYTRAIIPVHLTGQPVDMNRVFQAIEDSGMHIAVIEDACQAHGATYKLVKCGAMGDMGCFSFYPSKNLGAFGDGGMIVTDNNPLALAARTIRDYGSRQKYHHIVQGVNSRLDALQAAVLNVKLPHLDAWNAMRRGLADHYLSVLKDVVRTQEIVPISTHVYHLFVIETSRRDELREFLADHDIQTGVHYPIPMHLQPVYAHLGYHRGDFPVTERLADRMLSLPMHPFMSYTDVDFVCSKIKEFFA